MCAAAERLHRGAMLDDVPRLCALLNDDDAIMREAAAWPLSELAGVVHLGELLSAYQRGFDDGFDNDGFTTALIELAASHPAELARERQRLSDEGDPRLRESALWLMEFDGV